MAYAALISLKQTIQRLLNSSQISILPPSRELLEFAYKEVISLEEVLQRLESSSSSERVNSLTEQIRETVCKFEDALESHVSNQILSQSESPGDGSCSLKLLSLELEEVKEEIISFTETVKKMEDECNKEHLELSNPLPVPSRNYSGGKNSEMFGLHDEFNKLKDDLLSDSWSNLKTVSLVGMAGIGKTRVAEEVYEDPEVRDRFRCRAWVRVGPKYELKEILLVLLAQMDHEIDEIRMKGDEELLDYLHQSLYRRRYLIVFDDVWNTSLWVTLEKYLAAEHSDRGRVLLTTRLEEVARCADRHGKPHQIGLLNRQESWHLLREKVFGGRCPRQFDRAGKKIANNCEGLPLTIVTVADLLQSSEAKMTSEYWKAAAEKRNSLFEDAHDEMSKALLPSYRYLPLRLKACFLYIGVFPLSCQIPASKLINLWSAEGFLEPNPPKTLDDFGRGCLEDLVSRSLVQVCERQQSSGYRTKTCSLHSAFWHLCIRLAEKEKLFHVVNGYFNSIFEEDIKKQRRLCIRNNILFGIKEVHDSVQSISAVHSLLCTGPYHQYPVPICFNLSLLTVLDALTIRLYKFPIEVLKLVLLRYLALTYNGKLPSSISKLWNLHYLIVRRHLSIKSSEDNSSSYLPVEIWDMKELKHLQFMGVNLPEPPCGDDGADLLPNLLTLSDVSAHSCTKSVLERIKNLKKLGIRIELGHNDVGKPLSCCDHLSQLHKLESFKCVIVNPNLSPQVVGPPASHTSFPECLKKLTLSGLGYPWEYMTVIAQLRNLQVLKLRCYAFQGPEWIINDGEFDQLRVLLIEDTDLEYWNADDSCFRSLEHLIIRHCYKLKDIPSILDDLTNIRIELVDCPSAVDSVEQIQKSRQVQDQVCVHSSWDEGKLIKS